MKLPVGMNLQVVVHQHQQPVYRNVVKINIINQKPKLKMKQGRKSHKSGYKKAIITLKKGQSIDLTSGV